MFRNYVGIFILFFLQTSLLYSASPRALEPLKPGYPIEIETLNFDVLDMDFDKGFVSFKHTYAVPELRTPEEKRDGLFEPHLCSYPNLRDRASGVILGVYDLKNDKIKEFFPIYESTYDPKKCTSAKQSKENLEKAKSLFISLGLGIEENSLRKRGITPYFNYGYNRGLRPDKTLAGNILYFNEQKKDDLKFAIWITSRREEKEIQSNSSSSLGLGVGRAEEFTVGEIKIAKRIKKTKHGPYENDPSTQKIIWTRIQRDGFSMGSGGIFYMPHAYFFENKAVFLEWFYHENGFMGANDSSVFSFTPVIDLLI